MRSLVPDNVIRIQALSGKARKWRDTACQSRGYPSDLLPAFIEENSSKVQGIREIRFTFYLSDSVFSLLTRITYPPNL
jgi:hypothetical protein